MFLIRQRSFRKGVVVLIAMTIMILAWIQLDLMSEVPVNTNIEQATILSKESFSGLQRPKKQKHHKTLQDNGLVTNERKNILPRKPSLSTLPVQMKMNMRMKASKKGTIQKNNRLTRKDHMENLYKKAKKDTKPKWKKIETNLNRTMTNNNLSTTANIRLENHVRNEMHRRPLVKHDNVASKQSHPSNTTTKSLTGYSQIPNGSNDTTAFQPPGCYRPQCVRIKAGTLARAFPDKFHTNYSWIIPKNKQSNNQTEG